MIARPGEPVTAARPGSATPRWRRLAAMLCAIVMALGVAPPVAAAAESQEFGYDLQQVPMGWTDLGQQILIFRSEHPEVSHRSNVAIFAYERGDVQVSVAAASVGSSGTHVRVGVFHDGVHKRDESRTIPVAEFERRYGVDPVNKHSEELVYAYLSQTDRERVTRGESELQPCLLPGHQCRVRLQRDWFSRLETMRYHDEYGDDRHQRRDAVDALERRLNDWVRAGSPVDPLPLAALFTPPGRPPPAGGLVNALSEVPGQDRGGIDLTTLELRYLADPPTGGEEGLRFAFGGLPGGAEPDFEEGQTAALQASDAFFVWLALDPATFWVNLHPDEPDRIVDPQLGSTDVGRILLEADLQLKKTTSELIHPDTDLGLRYWNQLDLGDGERFCDATRQWIVPASATVYERQGELYILDAPLSLRTESGYLAEQDIETVDCPGQPERVRQHNEEVFRTLIRPEVERAVNEAPEYEQLRRVYLSRVAAEWYRHRSARTSTMFADLIASGDVSAWPARVDWSPEEVFDRFVESYTKGEFRVTHETRRGSVIETVTYISGGVDFLTVPFDRLDAGQFDSAYQKLPATVEASFLEAAADDAGRMWLGSVTAPRPVDASGGSGAFGALPRLALVTVTLVLFVMVAGIVTGLVFVWRSRA